MTSTTAEYQGMVSTYASVGALAILIWDILDNVVEDYHLLLLKPRRKLTVATVAYVLSRIAAFGYSLTSVIFSTAPIGHCALLDRIALSWCPISISASGFLFFLRLRAIYNRDRVVVATFFMLWVALLIGGVLVPVSIKGGPVGSTKYCEDVSVSHLASYGATAPLVFDTLVLLAISWRLSRIPGSNSKEKNIQTMVFGTDLPTFTRTLKEHSSLTGKYITCECHSPRTYLTNVGLLTGHIRITVVAGIASAVLSLGHIVPVPLSGLVEDVFLVLVNVMACRVFRRTKSGVIRESLIATSAFEENVSTPIQVRIPLSDAEGVASKEIPEQEVV